MSDLTTNPERRMMLLHISPEVFATMLRHGSGWTVSKNGLPPDAKIAGVGIDTCGDVALRIEHPSFPIAREGCQLRNMKPIEFTEVHRNLLAYQAESTVGTAETIDAGKEILRFEQSIESYRKMQAGCNAIEELVNKDGNPPKVDAAYWKSNLNLTDEEKDKIDKACHAAIAGGTKLTPKMAKKKPWEFLGAP